MSGTIDAHDIALRLLLALLAGGLMGFNRSEHGRPAGLRTTLLVCVAAALAMIQANLIMTDSGLASSAAIRLDVMRLPLGILSGMGFIGAGAILRRGNRVQGVTTAATLWFVTVIGLCFGGGQIVLGLVATGIAVFALWGLKWIELAMPEDKHATFSIVVEESGPTSDEFIASIRQGGFDVVSCSASCAAGRKTFKAYVQWRGERKEVGPPPLMRAIAARQGVVAVEWIP